MALQVQRYDAGDPAVRAGDRDVLRRPAGACADRAAFLHRLQKNVGDGRVELAGAGIPFLGRDFGDRGMDADRDGFAGIVHRLDYLGAQPSSNMPSTSTATPPGNDATPTAARACFPASPNISTMTSEAPLTTCGISVKSGVQLTKPPSRSTRRMRSRSPPAAARACANTLSAQSRAACLPSSMPIPAPSLPTWRNCPFEVHNWPATMTRLPDTA